MPHLRLRWLEPGEDSGREQRQVIALVSAPNGRWTFKDITSLQRCEVVALRGGRFASRQTQHLVNRSQVRGKGGRPGPKRRRARPKAKP